MKNNTQTKKKRLFASEMIQIQEAIYRCRHITNQLSPEQQEELSKLEERMLQVKKNYDSCIE